MHILYDFIVLHDGQFHRQSLCAGDFSKMNETVEREMKEAFPKKVTFIIKPLVNDFEK